MTGLRYQKILAALAVCALALSPMVVASDSSSTEVPYTVECKEGATTGGDCLVDKKTFVGWRTYHAFCHVCHAQDAVGSTFAPSLVDRMKDIDKDKYLDSVANGYTGQIGVMPAWKDNPNVSKKYEELYAYLLARADDKLPPGRPGKKR